MAQITWRNVDAPNFSGSLDGLRVAGGMLNNATNSLNEGLKIFGEAQQQRADAAAINNALQYSDPAAYREALANGSLLNGVDPSQVSARTLAALDGRTGQLIDNAGNQQKQDILGYNFDRVQDQNINSDAARNAIGQIYAAQQSGNSALANRLIAENAGVLGNLTAEEQANLYRTGTGLAGDRLSNIGRNIDNQRGAFDLSRADQQYRRGEQANALIQDMLSRTFSEADRQAYISNYALNPNADPGVTALLRQAAGTGRSSSGSGLGGGTTGLLTGGGQLPANFQTIGDVVDGKSALLALNPRGTALGNYQITADTYADFAPKVFGDNWRNVDIRDADAQDAIGKAIWDSAKDSGKSIKGRWDSLTPEQAESLVGKPWEEVRTLIAQKESGASPNSLTSTLRTNNLSGDVVAAGAQARAAQNKADSPAAAMIQKSLNDDATPQTVADRLVKNDLKGTDRGWVLSKIQDIMERTGYGAAQAEVLLKNSITRDDAGTLAQVARTFGSPIDWMFNRNRDVNLGNGQRIDSDLLESNIQNLKDGTMILNSLDQQNLQDQNKAVAAAQKSANDAATQLYQLRLASQNNPGLIPLIPRYEQQAAMYQKMLDDALAQTKNNPSFIPKNFGPNDSLGKAAAERDRKNQKPAKLTAEEIETMGRPEDSYESKRQADDAFLKILSGR